MLKRVTTLVIFIHMAFILMLVFKPVSVKRASKSHVQIRTLVSSSKISNFSKTSSAAKGGFTDTSRHKKKTQQDKMSSISPQKSPIHSNRNKAATEEATVAKKRSSTTSKTADKKMPKTQQKKISKDLPLSILEEFDQALAKIEQNSYSKPKQPSSGLEKASIGSFEASVVSLAEAERQTLVDFLHQSLRLPELGEVQIRLTVGRNGTVLKMEVLLAESQKNREYLEQQLPLLHLPLQPIEEKTWIFTFKNEN